MNKHHSMTWFEWTMLIGLSIVWGGSFFFIALSAKELPSFTIVFLRVALASLILWPSLILFGKKFPIDLKIWKMFFTIGLINNVIPFSLITWGQHHIASGLASILNATTPFFTLLLAHFLTGEERISKNRLSGIVIGFFGIILIVCFFCTSHFNNHIFFKICFFFFFINTRMITTPINRIICSTTNNKK